MGAFTCWAVILQYLTWKRGDIHSPGWGKCTATNSLMQDAVVQTFGKDGLPADQRTGEFRLGCRGQAALPLPLGDFLRPGDTPKISLSCR